MPQDNRHCHFKVNGDYTATVQGSNGIIPRSSSTTNRKTIEKAVRQPANISEDVAILQIYAKIWTNN